MTIREVLENSCFRGATVIAGHGGLKRTIRWVHVMEVTEIRELLSGNELILSTGIGWGDDKNETSLTYLKQLIDAGASGLCVELVKYMNEIPREMVELANKNHFPLIVFHKEVRFIDITQMININLMNHQLKVLSDLISFPKYDWIGDFDLLTLEHTVINTSKDLLEILYVEEQKKSKEKQWVHGWLKGEHQEEEILQYVFAVDSTLKPKGVVACVCRMEMKIEDFAYSYLSFFKMIFQNHGLFLFSVIENKHLIFILINVREDDWKIRVSKALHQIRQTDLFKRSLKDIPLFGVGKYTESLHKLSDSFSTAIESLQIQIKVNRPHEIFYENLHIYRLVSVLHKQGNLLEYIDEYLGLVIKYDQKHNSELLHTLAVLLESNGSKKDAAKRLFIVRQTLYHRLDKLKQLLGEDYMEPTKRAAIELSLYAHRYLSSSNQAFDSEIRAIH